MNNREIKFRVWDKTESKMIAWGSMQAWMIGVLENTDVMQYTGLKDKNRKEIYEGDIVEFPPFDPESCEGEYLPSQRFTVSLENCRSWLKEERFGNEGELLLEPKDCTIIGTVYQNPELL